MAKCGGIPKVITILGQYIKPCTYDAGSTLSRIEDNFMVMLETEPRFYNLSGLFNWMRRYFDTCPDLLKPCIFYLPVFPIDQHIRKRRLVRRWIAEGYSRDTFKSSTEENGERLSSKHTSRSTADENGEILFSMLVDLSIIQEESNVLCQVNGFFNECIISLEDNLVFALQGRCRLNSQRSGQHLTIKSCWDRDKTVFESIDFSRVRSFTVVGKWNPFFMCGNINMRVLRVLDLEDTLGLTNDDLEQIGNLVPCLKFLSLRGCNEITRLPDSVGDLSQLQTLDIKNTSIVMLPQGIVKLQKMQYIRAGTTIIPEWDEGDMVTIRSATDEVRARATAEDSDMWSLIEPAATCVFSRNLVCGWLSKFCSSRQLDDVGVKVPAGIGNLMALHTVGTVNVNVAGGKAFLKALKELTQLRRLRVSGIKGQTVKELFSAISDHGHLECLWVQFDKDKRSPFVTLDDTISKPPKTVKSLKLKGHVRISLGWMKDLSHLTKLFLEMTTVNQDDTVIFHEFRNYDALRRLCVKPIGDLEITNILQSYWYLKDLEIDCTSCSLDSEIHVTFERADRDRTYFVEVLKVHCSSGSSLRLTGIKELERLREVWLKGPYGDALKQIQQQLAEWPQDRRNKPVLKLVQEAGAGT